MIAVLERVLMFLPVYFINMAGENDAMAAWLRQQPSIFQAETPDAASAAEVPEVQRRASC